MDIDTIIRLYSNQTIRSELENCITKITASNNYKPVTVNFLINFKKLEECYAPIIINNLIDIIILAKIPLLKLANIIINAKLIIDDIIYKFLDNYCRIHSNILNDVEFIFDTYDGRIKIKNNELEYLGNTIDILPNVLEIMKKYNALEGIYMYHSINASTLNFLLDVYEFSNLYITIINGDTYDDNTKYIVRDLLNNNKLTKLEFSLYRNLQIESLYIYNGYDINADLVLYTNYYNTNNKLKECILPFYHRSLNTIIQHYPNLEIIGVSLMDDPLEETFNSIEYILDTYPEVQVFIFNKGYDIDIFLNKLPNLII